jgi:hypothetical protein
MTDFELRLLVDAYQSGAITIEITPDRSYGRSPEGYYPTNVIPPQAKVFARVGLAYVQVHKVDLAIDPVAASQTA